jgi:hypothetical protein
MKRICVFAFFFVLAVYVSPIFSFSAKQAEKTTFSGILFYGIMPCVGQPDVPASKPVNQPPQARYWLKLDKPLVFSPGSKSQRVVNNLEVIFLPDMQEKAGKFVGRRVEVRGSMDCEMHYTPWTATCTLHSAQITLSE